MRVGYGLELDSFAALCVGGGVGLACVFAVVLSFLLLEVRFKVVSYLCLF